MISAGSVPPGKDEKYAGRTFQVPHARWMPDGTIITAAKLLRTKANKYAPRTESTGMKARRRSSLDPCPKRAAELKAAAHIQ